MTTYNLASQAALDATNAKLTTVSAQVAALATRLGLDETMLAALVAAQPPPVVLPPPVIPLPPVGTIFSSEWTNGVKDTWDTYDEFNGGSGVTLMSVVPGFGPGGRNALKVVQAGDPPGYAANLRKLGLIVPGVDYYVRFYFRDDDTSPAGDHVVTCHYQQYGSLIYLRKMSGPTSWQAIMSMFMDEAHYLYPVGHWFLRDRLANGRWYRLEYFVHWTDATHIQVHPRIYDDTGALLYQDADYQQSDFGQSGNLSWGGRADWTLASYYAEPRHADGRGHDFQVDPVAMTEFGLGNNGQQGSSPTGLSWFFAGVAVSTQGWIGA